LLDRRVRRAASGPCGAALCRTHRAGVGGIGAARAGRAVTTDPTPPGVVPAAEWLTAVRKRWSGGHLPDLAGRLADLSKTSPDGAADLTRETVRSLLNQVHLVVPGLRRLLDILVQQGFLTPTVPADGDHLGIYHLTVTRKGGRR
jgi:hypothetical protein